MLGQGTRLQPCEIQGNQSGGHRSVWNIRFWVKTCSQLLLKIGAVGLSILTIWVLVGSVWFPEWWYIAIWEGEAIHTSYLAYGFSFLLDQERSRLFCIVLVAAIVTLYLYIKKTQFKTAIDRSCVPAIVICFALLTLDVIYLRQPRFRQEALLIESISRSSQAMMNIYKPQEPPQILPPIDFFYIDDTHVNDVFGEMEPELIETQRTISSKKEISGSAGLRVGPADMKGEITKEGQESSKYERSESSAKRRCIEIMNFVLKNGSGHYYTTAREYYGQQEWARVSEAGRKAYQEASKGKLDPSKLTPLPSAEEMLASIVATDANIEATARAQLAEPTPEQRLAAMKQIASWNQGFRQEARGFVIVDGRFHITRNNDSVVFEEEFSPQPDKIVFRFTLPSKFDSNVFRDGFRMRVFGDVIQGGENSSVLTIHPLAVFNE